MEAILKLAELKLGIPATDFLAAVERLAVAAAEREREERAAEREREREERAAEREREERAAIRAFELAKLKLQKSGAHFVRR